MKKNIFFTLCILLASSSFSACSHNPFSNADSNSLPIYFLDNDLPFQPKRIWRAKINWDFYGLDIKKAMVVKEIYYIVKDTDERLFLEKEILDHGGDQSYLHWLESEIHPIGLWEKRDVARIERHSEYTVAILTFRAVKDILKSEQLTVQKFIFPDPLLQKLEEGCESASWDTVGVPSDSKSIGIEVILESRAQNPKALRWEKKEGSSPQLYWKSWSVSQGKRMSYRSVIRTNGHFSRCPLPPEIFKQVQQYKKETSRDMGVEWGR